MQHRFTPIAAACATLTTLILAACGGSDDAPSPAQPTTTDVAVSVVDGAIQNALVCLDADGNGRCEDSEVHARTDAAGKATLVVDNADVGKYAVVAMVGTDAVDADHGAVATAYVLSAPADHPALVTPLTTLVQRVAASTGASSADAEKSLQASIDTATSLFDDYTTATPGDGSVDLASVARLVVLTMQQQAVALADGVGADAVDGTKITQADVDAAILLGIVNTLPALVSAAGDAALPAGATPAEKEAALKAAAENLVAASALDNDSLPLAVGILHQGASTAPVEPAVPSTSLQLNTLTYTDADNYFERVLTSSLAQGTPDADGVTHYVDRRLRSVAGSPVVWGSGADPWRQGDLNWNGTAWVACPINFESRSSARNAAGVSQYTYCDGRETGSSQRATFDVGDRKMVDVYNEAVAAGYTNLYIADVSVLGDAKFPSGAKVHYQTNVPLAEAVVYTPSGDGNPVGTAAAVSQYSAAIAAGGMAADQPANTACNSAETRSGGSNSTTLEGMIAAKAGTPCVFGAGTFSYGGTTYASGDRNEWWGNSTVGIGKLGSAPVNAGTAPGYYTGNTLLRVGFSGGSSDAVSYYACQERFSDGSPRNCAKIGSGTYSIATLGDARVLTLSNPPAQASALTYSRAYVERGGLVYSGFRSKTNPTRSVRLNGAATTALLQQLALPVEDPSVPLKLTAGSYQGTWDVRDVGDTDPAETTTLYVHADGGAACQYRGTFYGCTVTITDPATGAFTFSDDDNPDSTASGRFDYLAGTASGTYHDPSATPTDGSFTARRR